MKTTILQCLQQFSSKNSKNVYHDQFLKKLKLQCHCKFTGKLLQTLQNSSFHKTCYLEAKTNVLHNFALAL